MEQPNFESTAERAKRRWLLTLALESIAANDPVVAPFKEAFEKRAKLSWLPESDQNRVRALCEGMRVVLAWARQPTGVTCPPSVGLEGFWSEIHSAMTQMSDSSIYGFFYHMWYYGLDYGDPKAVHEALLGALQNYTDRTHQGLGMSPDPW